VPHPVPHYHPGRAGQDRGGDRKGGQREQQASAEAARERFTRFIGDGRAYTGGR